MYWRCILCTLNIAVDFLVLRKKSSALSCPDMKTCEGCDIQSVRNVFHIFERGGGGGGANDVFVYGGIITKSYISRYGKTSPQYKADNKFWSLLLSNNRHCLLCVLYTPLCHLTKEWRSVIIPAVNTLYTYTLYTLYTLRYTVKKG